MTSVATERELLLQSLDELLAASAALRRRIRAMEVIYRRARTHTQRGSPVDVILSQGPASAEREELTRVLEAFDLARHNTRREFMVLGREEGLTVTRLAELWGFSRQLAGRYLQEAEEIRRRRSGRGTRAAGRSRPRR